MSCDKCRIIFIHFLNDFSGSPNMLSIIATEFVRRGYQVEIITNRDHGFLSDIGDAKYRFVHYKLHRNSIFTFLHFSLCQIELLYKILFNSNRDTIYYINTISPIGAALACRLSGKNIVYHSHENMKERKALYRLYRLVYKICNRKTIFVSHYVKSTASNCYNFQVIPNALSREFVSIAQCYIEQYKHTFSQTILMVASLRVFKGVYEFVELAKRYREYTFELVLNATKEEVLQFVSETNAPSNIKVFSAQKDLHPFYQRAKLLLQMSNPNQWVETFGLTILEAMFYGIPSIVPNAGGPLELVEDGVNGFTLVPQNLDQVGERLELLMEGDELYKCFSEAALTKSKEYDVHKMMDKIEKYIIE